MQEGIVKDKKHRFEFTSVIKKKKNQAKQEAIINSKEKKKL